MRKLLFKLALFMLAVMAVQALLYHAVLHQRLPETLRTAEALSENPPDVIYFGDSSTFWNAGDDTDRRGLDRMVDDNLPGFRAAAVNHNAYHLEVFDAFTCFFAEREGLPRCLLVTINPRSFGPLWDRRPEYQFMHDRDWLRFDNRLIHYFFRFLSVFNAFDLNPVSRNAFYETPVMASGKQIGVAGDFINPHAWKDRNAFRAAIFQCNYMYTLHPDHPKLRALANLLKQARSAQVQVLCYVTPIDMETGLADIGGDFREQVKANIGVIRECVESGGAELLDLSELADAEEFDWHLAPNEHLRDSARLRAAGELGAAIRRILEE